MSRSVVALLVVAFGCMDRPRAPADAGTGDASAADFFGEACVDDPAPALTVCHLGRGWCVAAICRPQCNESLAACAIAPKHFTDGGACYCAP